MPIPLDFSDDNPSDIRGLDYAATSVGAPIIELGEAVSLIGQFPALAGVNLVVRAGEVVLVRGPNGAGKSTLLRLCSGLASLTSGSGRIAGHDISLRSGRRAVRREVGLLGHATSLYDELTVEQNIRFWVRANRSDETMIEPVMHRFGLAGRLRSIRVAGLSAGQRRRTAMAIVVCRRPSLWLLDEPHSGLDEEGRTLVDDLVVQASQSGATVLIASHEVDRVSELAARTLLIAGGRVHDDAPAQPGTAQNNQQQNSQQQASPEQDDSDAS